MARPLVTILVLGVCSLVGLVGASHFRTPSAAQAAQFTGRGMVLSATGKSVADAFDSPINTSGLNSKRYAPVSLRTSNDYDPYGIWALPWGGRIKPDVADANGIPMVDYGGKIGVQYNPGTIAATFGLTYYNNFVREGQASDLAYATRMGDWLVKNQTRNGAWVLHFSWVLPGGGTIPSPWPSAYIQGAALSLLVRLSQATGNHAYLNSALKGLKPFTKDPAHAGFTDSIFGHTMYEEYPFSRPTATLNGFMVGLVGLYDLSRAAPKSMATRLFNAGYRSLVALSSYWDAGCTQMYWLFHLTSVTPRAAYLAPGLGYKTDHVQLLDALTSIRPNKKLAFYREVWRKEVGVTSCDGF